MKIRIAAGVLALAVAPTVSACSINIGDCVDFASASAKLVAYQAAIAGGELTDAEVADAQDAVSEARGEVPDDVADEFNVVADAIEVSITEYQTANADGEITEAEWTSISESFDTAEVNQAFDDMGTWVDDNCVPGN